MRYQLLNRNDWFPFAQLAKQFEDELYNSTNQNFKSPTVTPRMEWQENEKAYLLSFDVPGMRQEDIRLEFKDNTLLVSAERKQKFENKEGDSLRSEKYYGVYHRSIELPQSVDGDNVQAEYNNGVLEVLIPKMEKVQAKNIQISQEGKIAENFWGKKEKTIQEKIEKSKSH
jgi:HSP20 family protein